ncbi:MAG: FIST C-terminal domain-containing protein, partial [Sulfurimonas sp.]|nr:FIST C-terminal domain-containing protein [Sulfurimonas sp.]
IISVSVFEKSTICSVGVVYENSSYDMGKAIASKLDSSDAKAMILFTTGLTINGEQFLNGVRSVSKDKYLIAGGLAGDNGEFKQTFVSHQNKIYKKGAVGVILKGDELNAKNTYLFGWDAVGLPMKVTKSVDNRVYELNNIPIIDIYKKYFGVEISTLLPRIGVEIPLMLNRNGNKIARACINKFDDNSLLFAGDIMEGEDVRFGIGSVDIILRESKKICEKFSSTCNPETIFVYSCMARRRLLNLKSSEELKIMASKYSVSGFFTYGEFFSDEKDNYLFNETMTILTLTESEFIVEKNVVDILKNKNIEEKQENHMMHALTHMTNVIAREWQEKLDEEIEKNKEQERQSFQKNKLAQMGEMIGMIAHQWRQPLNAISATGINLSLLSNMNMLEKEKEKVQESSEFIQEQCQKMSNTIDTFINFVKPAKESKGFKLSHTVEEIMQIMGTQLANHNIKVNIQTTNENISLVGYEDLLEQVIINILSNSRDAFENKDIVEKYINIKIDMKENIPIISIEDNAGGIPHAIRDKIFNPYFTTKEQGKGTGIGLYMSMDIMKRSFDGDLIYSATDSGSRFEIVFEEIIC